MEVRPTTTVTARDYVNLITISGNGHSVAGTLMGLNAQPKVVMVDDAAVDIPPADHMLVVHNDDTPGMIGAVGTILGRAGVNIGDMAVGQTAEGVAAAMVIVTDRRVEPEVVAELEATDGIGSVAVVRG